MREGARWFALPLLAAWLAASACGKTGGTDAASSGAASGGAAGQEGEARGGRRTTAVPLFGSGAQRGGRDAEDTGEETLWSPPIALGSSGWKQSNGALCFRDPMDSGQVGPLTSFGVWADQRSVATSVTWACAWAGCNGGPTRVRSNSGRGWETLLTDAVGGRSTPATNQLSGFPGGPLILLNYSTYDFSPYIAPADSVAFLGSNSSSLEPPLGASDAAFATAAFGVLAATGYVLIAEGEASAGTTVHRYLHGSWQKVDAIPSLAQGIWASETRMLVAANDGIYEGAVAEGKFFPRVDAPNAEYTSIWALTENDVWAGTARGELVHFDGGSWVVWETGEQAAITRLWGGDGEVFYMSDELLGRFKGGVLETLVSAWPGLRLWDLWGRSAREVFVTLTDEALANYRCGPRRILWFDGAEFHSF